MAFDVHSDRRSVESGQTWFLLTRTGAASAVRGRLLCEHRIPVRDCTSFGLPDNVRSVARGRADSDRLVAALADVRR